MAEMVRRQCALCRDDEACAIMYIAEEQNVAVHQDCLLYSSGFVESEEHNPENLDKRFDVASVVSERKRGKKLACNFCHKKGATVGCETKHCRRSYHYFCALRDCAVADQEQGTYRMHCPNHVPDQKSSFYDGNSKKGMSLMLTKSSSAGNKKRKVFSGLSENTCMDERDRDVLQPPALNLPPEDLPTDQTVGEENMQVLWKKHDRHKARIEFLKKCKQAGLLGGIFEKMLATLHLAQKKLMDDNTSEAEYEETVISLFDCGLFENILTAAYSGTEEKIQELMNTQKRLDAQIELLKGLKETVLPVSEDTASTSNSVSEYPTMFYNVH